MPGYKLTYFNLQGKAEIIRLIFAAAGVEYDDHRIQFEDWGTLKQTTPFGQVPTLEVDGVTYCQTEAISRFLARKFGLAGKSELDQLRVDMIIGCLTDIRSPISLFLFEKDEAKKAEETRKYVEEKLPTFLKNLELLFVQNHSGEKFFVGDELTWADLGFLALSDWLLRLKGVDVELAKHAKLSALRKRVQEIPRVAAWLEKRPKTER